ncbi:MAG: alpha/beta hydrolase, partial [Alphaproteobacteria bacterium]
VSGATLPWKVRDLALFRALASPPGRFLAAPVVTAFFPNSLAADIIREIFAPNPVPPDYAVRTGAALAVRRATLAADARQIAALPAETARLEDDVPALALPVEIVHGTEDRIVPPGPTAVRLSRLVPGANLVLLPDTGHMPHHVRPEAVIEAVDRAARRPGVGQADATATEAIATEDAQE